MRLLSFLLALTLSLNCHAQFSKASFSQSPTVPLVIFDGNSLTQQTADNGYVPSTISLLGFGYQYVVAATGGQTTAQMLTLAPTKIVPQYSPSRTKNIIVAWEILNDVLIGGASAAGAYNSLVSYCEAVRSAGFKVVVVTALPANGATYPSFAATRATINTNIRTNWATFADALADIGGDSTIGDDGDELNTTNYQADGVHLKAPGGTIVAGYVKDAILTL